MPLFAIECAIDDVAGVGQRRRQLTIEIRIVFNNEQAQVGLRKVSRQSRRLQDEPGRRECRMNNDEYAPLLFLHNRFLVEPGAPSPAAALSFSTLRPDPKT